MRAQKGSCFFSTTYVSEFEIGIRRVRGSRLIDLVGRWEVGWFGRIGQDLRMVLLRIGAFREGGEDP